MGGLGGVRVGRGGEGTGSRTDAISAGRTGALTRRAKRADRLLWLPPHVPARRRRSCTEAAGAAASDE